MGASVEHDERVRVVASDAAWPGRFEQERALLEGTIGIWATGGIHHVGSTAVPGLDAKPTIDILVGVRDLTSSRAVFQLLAGLGYKYAPYRTNEMHWFCKPDQNHRTHHLHLVPTGSERYENELAFRDLLRAKPEAARAYALLKRGLALEHPGDREAYTEGKTTFIARALAAAPRGAFRPC